MSGAQDPAAQVRAQEAALLGMLNQLWGDVEVGESVRKRAKALNPNIAIPDENPVAVAVRRELATEREKREALEKQISDDRAERMQRDAEASLRNALGRAQDRFKLTDEGMAGTIKLMQERQIADAEAAAALYVDSLPKAKPSAASNFQIPGKFNMFGTTARDEAWEKLHLDQEGFFADVVNQVFSEMPAGG